MYNHVFQRLVELSNHSYGNNRKESAILTTCDGKEYTGVSVYIKEINLYSSAITNAICNAVSSGDRSFDKLIVYIDSTKNKNLSELKDNETLNLLKEFNINSYDLYCNNGELIHIVIGER